MLVLIGLRTLPPYLLPMKSSPQTRVQSNANCPDCIFDIRHVERIADGNLLPIRWDDLKTMARKAWGLDADTAARRLYVQPNGMRTLCIRAFLVRWAQMPHYRLLGRIVGLPGIRQIAIAAYDHVLAPLTYRWHLHRLRKTHAGE